MVFSLLEGVAQLFPVDLAFGRAASGFVPIRIQILCGKEVSFVQIWHALSVSASGKPHFQNRLAKATLKQWYRLTLFAV